MQHLEVLLAVGTGEALALAAERGQLHQDPERHHQTEADGDEAVGDAGADRDGPRRALAEEVGRPRAHGGQHVVDALAHALVLEQARVAMVDAVAPVDSALHIAGDALHQVGELVAEAEHRREHQDEQRSEHDEHDDVGDGGADAAVDAALLEAIDDAAQAEHDDGRPDDHAHGSGQHVEQVDRHRGEQDRAHRRPNAEEPAARLERTAPHLGGEGIEFGKFQTAHTV